MMIGSVDCLNVTFTQSKGIAVGVWLLLSTDRHVVVLLIDVCNFRYHKVDVLDRVFDSVSRLQVGCIAAGRVMVGARV